MAELEAIINRSTTLKTSIQSNIEQLGRCSVKIKHNDKCVNCRFLLVPGNGLILLRMLDIELLSIIRVMCEIIGNKATNKKFETQTRPGDSQNCKTNKDPQAKQYAESVSKDKTNIPDYLNFSTNKTHMPDYFISSENREADKVRQS